MLNLWLLILNSYMLILDSSTFYLFDGLLAFSAV